jgi:hypothetical protein
MQSDLSLEGVPQRAKAPIARKTTRPVISIITLYIVVQKLTVLSAFDSILQTP